MNKVQEFLLLILKLNQIQKKYFIILAEEVISLLLHNGKMQHIVSYNLGLGMDLCTYATPNSKSLFMVSKTPLDN